MIMLNNFSIAKRLYLVSFILIAALVAVSVYGWYSLSRVSDFSANTDRKSVV